MARINVHDIPEVEKQPLCYAVPRFILPRPSDCKNPYVVKLRAILSWEVVPPPGDPDFVPPWGNRLEAWVQIDPTTGQMTNVVSEEKCCGQDKPKEPEKERLHFLEILKENPNSFGTLPKSDLQVALPKQYDTTYEELRCVGLYPERDYLEAVLKVKLPFGFLTDLCGPGSYEYVRFFIDLDQDGDFYDASEDAGVATVNVHDIPVAGDLPLSYALGRHFQALHEKCERPYIVKVRAILSWQQVPVGPDFVPVWGNVVECYVQIRPYGPEEEETLVAVITGPAESSPPQCVSVGPTAVCGLAGVTITGWACGTGFASYRISYRPVSSLGWLQAGVVYPDCSPASATPDHSTPKFGEPLAFLENLEPDEYEVCLQVDGAGGPIYAYTHFSLSRSPVVIDQIGAIPTLVMGVHPDDVSELLKLVKLGGVADPETSVGGSISIVGSADFYGCGRQMIEYVLQHQWAPFGSNPPQQDDLGPWTDIKPPLPFGDATHPRWYYCWPTNLPNYVLNGKLSRLWISSQCLLMPWPPVFHNVRRTAESAWDTTALNGRYTVRLRVKHQDLLAVTPVQEVYDSATVWLDNRTIQVRITELAKTGGATLKECAELRLSDLVGTTLDIKGRAWDPLILDSVAETEVPNDNFDHYLVNYEKDGSGIWVTNELTIADPTVRVPDVLPTLPAPPDDVGVLATWDVVTALDAGALPHPYVAPPYPKLYRGERCAYLIHLYACDETRINDNADIHDAEYYWPVCISNDLK
ncbi:MAG TPA: hypothetical protein PKO09_12775 [Anaerolineae bacterium]|nr:hypothetical protein [Anaerolineae bacterium]